MLKLSEADDIPTGLNAHAHLVSVVRAREHKAVNRGADQSSKDRIGLSNRLKRNVLV
jgi:hypothetical protein